MNFRAKIGKRIYAIKKRHKIRRFSGEGGIRTPGGFHLNGFQDRRNRPLCHLSAAKIHLFYSVFFLPVFFS